MSKVFINWLTEEMKQRQWSHRKLARESGLSQSLISRVISEQVPITADFCISVAQAFGNSPIVAMRLANILPSNEAVSDTAVDEITDLANKMPPKKRRLALRYLRFLFHDSEDDED